MEKWGWERIESKWKANQVMKRGSWSSLLRIPTFWRCWYAVDIVNRGKRVDHEYFVTKTNGDYEHKCWHSKIKWAYSTLYIKKINITLRQMIRIYLPAWFSVMTSLHLARNGGAIENGMGGFGSGWLAIGNEQRGRKSEQWARTFRIDAQSVWFDMQKGVWNVEMRDSFSKF